MKVYRSGSASTVAISSVCPAESGTRVSRAGTGCAAMALMRPCLADHGVDQDTALEAGPGADERDQVGCVDGAPAGLG